MHRRRVFQRLTRRASGQTFLEAVLVMPMFLLLAFLLLQIGHLGIAVAVVNYGASSAARQAVENNEASDATATQQFTNMLSLGLKFVSAHCKSDGDAVAPNVTVTTCAALPAYPFVGQFLDKALSKKVGGDSCASGAKALGPVALKGPAPFSFIIQGESRARMNYVSPKG